MEVRLDDDIVVETESVLIQVSLDNLRNANLMEEEGFGAESKKIVVQPIPISNLQYVSELGTSPLCSYHYICCEEKKLIGKMFKVSDLER